MIKANIKSSFPNHKINKNKGDLYVADYTQQTKNSSVKRSVEVFNTLPDDIETFYIENKVDVEIGSCIFDNNSFTYPNGKTKSQCEICIFPYVSKNDSWILFAELKYAANTQRNEAHFKKAIKQLYKTRYYYLDENVFSKKSNCYLIISMPKQKEPFSNFILTPNRITNLKKKHNIVLRPTNSVEVLNDKVLKV